MSRTAKIETAAYWVTCPHCGENLPCPDIGSHIWPADGRWPSPQVCFCGSAVALPKALRA